MQNDALGTVFCFQKSLNFTFLKKEQALTLMAAKICFKVCEQSLLKSQKSMG